MTVTIFCGPPMVRPLGLALVVFPGTFLVVAANLHQELTWLLKRQRSTHPGLAAPLLLLLPSRRRRRRPRNNDHVGFHRRLHHHRHWFVPLVSRRRLSSNPRQRMCSQLELRSWTCLFPVFVHVEEV